MTFFVRPIIRPPANLYKNDGAGGGRGGGPKFVYPEMAVMFTLESIKMFIYVTVVSNIIERQEIFTAKFFLLGGINRCLVLP